MPDLLLKGLGKTAGHAPPKNPILMPDRRNGWVENPFLEAAESLLAAPVVQRVAESGAEAVAGQLEKSPLMLLGSAASFRAGVEGTPKFAQNGKPPSLPAANNRFQPATEMFGFLRFGVA